MTQQEIETSIYNTDAAQEILRLAVRSRRMDFFTSEDLIRAASEMAVPESAVLEAEKLVRERQSEIDDRQEYRRTRVKEVARGLAIGVPLFLMICFLHVFSMVAQMFGALKGAAKGIGAIFFAKSTRHEVEFQAWRNKRFYNTMYGGDEPQTLIAWYFKDRNTEDIEVLRDWLINVNGIDPRDAERAIDTYARRRPAGVIQRRRIDVGSTTAARPVQENVTL